MTAVLKKLAPAFVGMLGLIAFPLSAIAQDESRTPDETRKIVIEYRDGTRQTILLEKEWWHILNILLPNTPAPLREEAPARPQAKAPVPPKAKAVTLDVSGKWINWRQGEKHVYTMRLVQTGRRVRGLHRLDPSYVIDGTLEGNVLKGTWSSPNEVGEFLFELSEDGRSFQGRWNTTSDLKSWKLGWNGRRQ